MQETKFTIPDEAQAKWPELVKLVTATESMDDNEKQYWFDVLPRMADEQVDKLFTILETERVKLLEIDRKFDEIRNKLFGDLKEMASALNKVGLTDDNVKIE